MNDGFQCCRSRSTMFYHPKTHARVVVHGDDFIFAATDSELRKMRSRMCEWYDVKVRGLLGSGKRDWREIETLGRNLRWIEKWLLYKARDKHRQALLEGLGLSEESKTVNRAVAKPEEIGPEEDANMLDEAERKKFRSLAATLNMRFGRSDVQYSREGHMHEDGGSDTRELQETEECSQISEKGVEKVTWAMRAWEHDEMKVEVRVDSDWVKGTRQEVDEWRQDDQRHSGETLVENTSDACAEHGGSCISRGLSQGS